MAQNFTEAAHWFERAAKQGLAPAQFRLAGLHEKGVGVRGPRCGAPLYLAAGEAGHAKALHNLAVLYAEGIDGKPDYLSAANGSARRPITASPTASTTSEFSAPAASGWSRT